MFKSLPEKISYPEIEHITLDFWEKNNIFNKTLTNREGRQYFCFYEGPPTVNGRPGIHHVIARTIKDAVCRYKTMKGFYVRRQAGWDTHGLPVEIAIQTELGLSSRKDVIDYGIDKFNKKCREFVYKNIEMDLGWRYLTRRMGYWVDLDKAYITCTNDYVESVWWALKTFFDKGLVYKGFKVVPQSPTIETPLSSHELSQEYRDVRDPNCFLKLKITSSNIKEIENAYIMVWTTTPWTLFANTALACGVDIDYVLVKNIRKNKDEESVDYIVLAEPRLSVLDGEYEILKKFKGSELIGTRYEQIFNYVKIDFDKYPDALSVLPGDFVSTEDGSGIVHLAPAFGEDDYQMSKKFKIPFAQPVTPNGHFTAELGEWAGRAIKTFTYPDRVEDGSDKDIVIALKIAGKIYRSTNDYLHSYPHCWRTHNPIMYYARDSWFIKSPVYKEEMIRLNKTINWQPPEIGAGRFGNWLIDVKEWAISRDRFWGTPLPFWTSEDGTDTFAIGSIEELKQGIYVYPDGTRKPVSEIDIPIDLHKPFVDHVIFERNGKTYKRIPEVVDVWFDSGSMPFAQMHYPFENQDLFEKMFPGDFIAEGVDQTRGWFFTLHNIATAVFDKPAYKNIVVNELILDEKGEKMSKHKGNTVDPFIMMEKYGADAIRWYFFANNPPWKPTLFSESDIQKTVISDLFRSLTNTYAFFALYANIDGFTGYEENIPVSQRPKIDKWIISRVNSLVKSYQELMDEYELTKAHREIQSFVINELSNWYIRRNRRRFWKGDKDNDKIAAYQTLREVLLNVLLVMSPAAPFLSEDLYQRIKIDSEPESIHLFDMPAPNEEYIDKDMERMMGKAQQIVFLGRSLREKSKIRVRQPLKKILIPVSTAQGKEDVISCAGIIKEELNIKEIEFITDESGIVKKSAKGNFKTLGKKFGKSTQFVANAIKILNEKQIKELEAIGCLLLNIENNEYKIDLEDVEILSENIEGWSVASDGGLTVALDTQIDEELLIEGIAREFVNRVQNLRKQSGFEVTDRISIVYNSTDETAKAIEIKDAYIKNETLASVITFSNDKVGTEIDLDDEQIFIELKKIK